MRSRVVTLTPVLLAALGLAVLGQGRDSKPDDKAIAKLIRDLGDGDFEMREKASEALWRAGSAAEKALQEAAKSDDIEVRKRARDILQKFATGQMPDTPVAVLDLLGEYQSAEGNAPRRAAVLRRLMVEGKAGIQAVVRMAANEPKGTGDFLLTQIAAALPSTMARIEAMGERKKIDELVEMIATRSPFGHAHLASWAKSTGTLKTWIEELDKGDGRVATWPAPARHMALMMLKRADGDLPGAIAAAEKAKQPNFVEALRIEAGLWTELAKAGPGDMNDPTHRAGLKSTFLRLAGMRKEFTESLEGLRELAGRDHDDGDRLPYSAKLMLLNDQTDEGIKILLATNHRALAFEVMAAQMRHKEAFALADQVRKAMDRDLVDIEMVEARIRWLLGDRKRSGETFDRLAEELKPGGEPPSWFEALIENEILAGRRDSACDHAARPFPTGDPGDWKQRLFKKLYPEKSGEAGAWWDHMAGRVIEGGMAGRLKLIGQILAGTTGRLKASELLGQVEEKREIPEDLRLAAADLARRAGLGADEERLLTGGKRAASRVSLGDAKARRGDWAGALQDWDLAETMEPGNPVVQVLRAQALDKLGRKPEAAEARALARRLPLGLEGVRSTLVQELARRGFRDEAAEHALLWLACSRPGSYEAGNAHRHVAQALARAEKYSASAHGQQVSLFRILGREISFIYPTAYVSVPALIHRLRARGQLAEGKVDEALAEMATCQKLMPRDIELPILVFDELAKRGRKAEAEKLYATALEAHEALIAEFPECAWARNGAAWLMACCRKDLERAVAHAEKAVSLNQESPGYRDTLAEALFQKGDKNKAIQSIQKAVDMDPKRVYYRRQLERISAGNPATPRPDENDDE